MLRRVSPPDYITVLHVLAGVAALYFLAAENFVTGFVFGVAAYALDVLDGFVARRYNWETMTGGVFDTVTDYVFLLGGTVILFAAASLPWFVWMVPGIMIVNAFLSTAAWYRYGEEYLSLLSRHSQLRRFRSLLLVTYLALVVLDAAKLLGVNRFLPVITAVFLFIYLAVTGTVYREFYNRLSTSP